MDAKKIANRHFEEEPSYSSKSWGHQLSRTARRVRRARNKSANRFANRFAIREGLAD